MNEEYTHEQFYCRQCKETWRLVNDKFITDQQHNEWMLKAIKEHNAQCTNTIEILSEE